MSTSFEMTNVSDVAPGRTRFALEAIGLSKVFRRSGGFRRHEIGTVALADVSVDLMPNEILAVVGESGSGKTTLGRIIVGLERPDRGAVRSPDTIFVDTTQSVFVPAAKRGISMIFQDPTSSLNPRMRIREIVGEGLILRGVGRREIRERCAAALETVGLRGEDLDRYPHQFSGGQRQRIASRERLSWNPGFWSPTKPFRRSTCRFRSRF